LAVGVLLLAIEAREESVLVREAASRLKRSNCGLKAKVKREIIDQEWIHDMLLNHGCE
jgi:hypothetical protein